MNRGVNRAPYAAPFVSGGDRGSPIAPAPFEPLTHAAPIAPPVPPARVIAWSRLTVRRSQNFAPHQLVPAAPPVVASGGLSVVLRSQLNAHQVPVPGCRSRPIGVEPPPPFAVLPSPLDEGDADGAVTLEF